MRALLAALICVPVLVPTIARADTAAEVTDALGKLASKSNRGLYRAPHFAFTSTAAWDEPQTLDLAQFGLPEVAVIDKTKTLVDAADAETAVISTNLAEFAYCAKPGCPGQTAQTWLRASLLLEKVNGGWQPVAWAFTPPIDGGDQTLAQMAGVAPEALRTSTTGADDVAKLFTDALPDPKKQQAMVSDKKDVVLTGSELPERYAGGKAVKAQLATWGLGFTVRDGVRAGATANGKMAWVAANVDGKFVKQPKMKPVPYRVFAVYEKVGADWKAVVLQFSTVP